MPRSTLLLALWVLAVAASFPVAARKKHDRAYIETSYLIAPVQVGDFELEGSSFDPGRKYAGAGFRYALKDHQEIRFDVYVYPAGLMAQEQAVRDGMEAFRHDLRLAGEQGTYTQLRELQQGPFPLPSPETPHGPPATGADVAVIKAQVEAGQLIGQKLQLSMRLPPRDWPLYSNGYLFYKQLYYFKLRASAAQERISSDEFNALTDRAARQLVPALQVANVGGCAGGTIHLSTDASPEQGAVQLVRQATLLKGHNCHPSIEEAGIADQRATFKVVEITFDADEWKSQ
ncbi:hypothetical protein [Stenotrophomonas sp. PS02297]|uniref:hypothetical protein n=1 Tax=Stenotrophomonas sp. PS02297 TaxID=2991423 RepID=UPI00249BF6F1|nr:hypothetical protein [Stenotrophomonas sp. PS02297]